MTGEISIINLDVAGMGILPIRITNLPPEIPEETFRLALASFGEIVSIRDGMSSNAYHYTVANGIKVLVIKLTKHFPSHMNIAGYSILPSCDAQPVTCYGCWDNGHM